MSAVGPRYHSLYWRIAVGFVACLALLLVVQAMLFVWVVARTGRTVPNQPPERLAQTIALDASSALERDPTLDLDSYIRREYASDAPPFLVLRVEGAPIEIGGPLDPTLVADARDRFNAIRRLDPAGRGRGLGPGGRFGLNTGPGQRGGRGFPPPRPFPIVVGGQLVGMVVVPPRPPFAFLLARYAPLLGLASLATLIVGALLAAFAVFGPARTRLRAVEDAARRLGAGDLTARAPDQGRDEVAAVASAFNAMAADLSARADALAASDRTRRQLLADVSHELTTPMTAIRGYLDTLTMPEFTLEADTRVRYLGIINDEASRLEHIIGDLLDLARLEGGGGPLLVDDVPVDALFARVVARHERVATESGVRIEVRVAAGAASVRAERERLEQALQNLTANALRYAPSGSAVVLQSRHVGDLVALTVEDAGPGIAPEHLPHVFDRFYRAEESRMRQGAGASGGSGLGLSIVKAIIERHGGSVSVRSTRGHTVFEVTLRHSSSPSLAS